MTIQENALRVAAALDSGNFPEELEPQYIAWLLRQLAKEDPSTSSNPEGAPAYVRFLACEGDKESDPLERLRFFCSLAMGKQDWLDVEKFFDDISAAPKHGE